MPKRHSLKSAALLERAVAHHQHGQLALAEDAYRAILKARPGDFHALHLLGVLRAQQARLDEAVVLIGKALAIDPKSAEANSNLGNALQGLHRHAEAIASYDRALALRPAYAEALNHRGNSLQALNRYDEAIASYHRVLAIQPNFAEALYSAGNALIALSHYDEAIASCDKALAIRPGYAEALNVRGVALQAMDRHADALASFDLALAVRPVYAAALYNRGIALQALDRHDDALASYDRALASEPAYVQALRNRGNALIALGRYEAALASYERALLLQPGDAAAHDGLGIALHSMGRHEEAIASYDRALASEPAHAGAFHHRGRVLHALNRVEDALADYDRALAIKPDDAEACNSRGDALEALNRHAEALASYDRALAIRPDYAEARVDRSLALLKNGDFAGGWAEYEQRWRRKDFRKKNDRGFGQPRWAGPAASGLDAKLLVWGEQGIGDEILYASMIPDLLAKGAELVIETDPRLVPLFARSFLPATVVPRLTPPHALTVDPSVRLQVPLGSLGRWLRPNGSAFPGRRGYLVPDAGRAATLRHNLVGQTAKPLVGVSWQSKGGVAHKNLALQDLAPVIAAADVTFVDLQYGDTGAERQDFRDRYGKEIVHLTDLDLFNDLEGVAALVHACDLIITSSSAVAHFAGALGKPVWILLTAGQGSIWYWFRDTHESPWYRSARLFRQPAPGDWASVVANITRELSAGMRDRAW